MITLMVVLNVSEDIEAKIRRLRELGKASTEPEAPKTAAPPVKKPPKKPRGVGSIRSRERRKRILAGAAVLLILILIISVGAYVYIQDQSASKLTNEKNQKLREVYTYFRGELVNSSRNCTSKPIAIRNELINEIRHANSLEELSKIDVKAAYNQAVKDYNACLANIEKQKQEKILNETKQQKIQQIETEFQRLLAMPLPDSLRAKVVASMKSLENQVENAKTVGQVNSINAAPYLLRLWREYYYYQIDNIPGQNVILEKNNIKRIVSKSEAKAILGGIMDYNELLQYRIYKVQYVDIALVLSRDRINGAFLSPGDEIMIFAKNSTNAPFKEIANEGYVEMVLLPTDAGLISVNEAQSQSSSSSTSSSTQYNEGHTTSYTPGGTSVSNGQSSSDTYSNSQSSSQSASASYSYTVDLSQILKAVAAGKIKASPEVKEELENYGWHLINLEQSSDMLVLSPNSEFLVIIKVPSIFVPDILSHQNYLYIAKVTS